MGFDPELIIGETAEHAADLAAAKVATIAEQAITRAGHCNLALAGGETPRALYRRLAAPMSDGGRRERVRWSAVRFFFGDERPVPPTHPDSNFRMAREALLDPLGVPPDRVWRIEGELPDAAEAAARYAAHLRARVPAGPSGYPRLDLVLLGLGSDAHTASWFPGTTVLADHERWVAPVWVPRLATWRITLTPPVVNAAAHVLFFVVGPSKAEAVQRVLVGETTPETAPARIVAPGEGRVTWVMDRGASALLPAV